MRVFFPGVLAVFLLVAGAFTAGPVAAEPRGPEVVREVPLGGSAYRVDVYSPSMDRVISNRVLRAPDAPAPTLYLLTGLGGGEDGISWWDDTEVARFFDGRHVNVVMPIGGAYSLYTDWHTDDPVVGRARWQTYLTRELPDALDPHLRTTGRNAIAGVSMSAGSAIDLAIQAPQRYVAVAAFSGCPWSADPVGASLIGAQVLRGGANPLNLWGTPGSAGWREHDAYLRAGDLAGRTVFLSSATGRPGAIDAGGAGFPPVEAIAHACTDAFAGRLGALGVPVVHVRRPEGSHTWGQFETDLYDSWHYLAGALGA